MMRVKVLKAPTGSASNLVRYYADTAPGVSDYYVDPAEPEGRGGVRGSPRSDSTGRSRRSSWRTCSMPACRSPEPELAGGSG